MKKDRAEVWFMPARSTLKAALVLSCFAAASLPPVAFAADAHPEPNDDAREEKPTALSVSATPVIPVGDLSEGVGVGIGGLFGVDYGFRKNIAFVGRAGYIHHLPKDGINATLGAVPIYAGARYRFSGLEGPYVEGMIGPTVLFATVDVGQFGRQSDSEVRLGTTLGGGYRVGPIDLGGRFVIYDLGHADDSMGLMASIGWSFAAF